MPPTNETLLVIIDPQKDFTHPAGAYARKQYGLQQIVQAKNKLVAFLSSRYNIPVVVVQSAYQHQQFGPGLSIAIPGTFGHQIDLPIDASVKVITKTAHSAFTAACFSRYLKEQGYRKLLITGFLAEYCIWQTAADALANGFEVVLIDDCIGTGDLKQPHKAAALEQLKQKGATVWPTLRDYPI